MRKSLLFLLFGLAAMLLGGCSGRETPAAKEAEEAGPDEFTDFYYTYEWDGYNAEYQRYRFYPEGGRHMFFHETRKVHDDYGPATEKNTTAKGTKELTDEEWNQFLAFLDSGNLSNPEEELNDGDSGPWMYAYFGSGENQKRLSFQFSPRSELLSFEEFCEGLVA